MWEFIKYCLRCFGCGVSAAFGYVPEGMTSKDVIVGCVTMAVLTGLFLGALWLFVTIANLINRVK